MIERALEAFAEIQAEELALAEYQQAAAAREPAVVSSVGQGGGRVLSVLDEARQGEEQARREFMEMSAPPVVAGVVAQLPSVAATSSDPIEKDGADAKCCAAPAEGIEGSEGVLVSGTFVEEGEASNSRYGGVPALGKMHAQR